MTSPTSEGSPTTDSMRAVPRPSESADPHYPGSLRSDARGRASGKPQSMRSPRRSAGPTASVGRRIRADGKRYLWMFGILAPASAMLPSQLVYQTGLSIFWWAGPMIFFILIPVIDGLVGEDGNNPPDEAIPALQNDKYYRWLTYLYLPMQYLSLWVVCWLWTFGSLTAIDKLGQAISLGLVAGISINAAHELGHRSDALEGWLSKIALAQTFYGHFYVEHNRGHHVRVATPEDPASARMGESLYRFFPRTVIGSLRSGWSLEVRRLATAGYRWWNPRNHILQAWAFSLVLLVGLTAFFGWGILPLLLIQAVVGIMLLEGVNYVEHYGLLRKRDEKNRLERIRPEHSWNSDRLVTNIFLYHLQRHSDHHAYPGRRYQTLRSWKEAPQLPYGYATMVVFALCPPLWRRIMDPRLLDHVDGRVEDLNLAPHRRRKLLARYGGAS